jgi:hypothetical protein
MCAEALIKKGRDALGKGFHAAVGRIRKCKRDLGGIKVVRERGEGVVPAVLPLVEVCF